MIRRTSYLFYRHANKTAGRRATLTTAVPVPAPVPDPLKEDDHYALCFNLAADLLSKDQFSAARKVLSRLANCPSVRDAVSAVVFAGSRGLELDPGARNGLIRKLVDSGQFELAYDVYVHGVSGGGGELDSDTDTENSVFFCLVKLGKFEEARERFDGLVARGDVPCINACKGLVLELCRQGRLLEAFDCFVKVSESGLVMDANVYNVLISGLCDKGRMDEARKVFVDLCDRSGLMPTLHLFKCLFFSYCKKGLTVEAEKIFSQMEEFGKLGDKVMYTSLINYYCKEGNVGMAMGFLGRMKKTGCEPDNYTYKTLIHGYVKTGLFDQARELLHKLNEAGELDDVAFHFKMTMDCKEGKLEFKQLFDLMRIHNLVPGVHYYTTLIAALYKTNNMAEIHELLKHMEHDMVIPDHVFFLILRKIVKQGHPLEGCLRLLWSILENGTLDPLLQSTSPPQDLELEIEQLLEEIARRNLYLASVGYAIYISALCEEGRTDIASACLLKMKDIGCRPLVFTFNSLINWYCLNGLFEDMQLLIDFMEEENMVPDSATYLIRIKGYCRRMDPDAAFSLLREMGSWGLRPSVAMYDLIVGCLSRMGRMSEAETLFNEMVDSGIMLDGTVYTTMINAYCRNGKAKEAQLLFEDMVKNSVQPSCHSYTTLISGLVKGNKIVEACEYQQRMLHDDFRPNIALFTSLISHFLRKREFVYAFRLVNMVDTNMIDRKFEASLSSGIFRVICRTKKRRYVPNKPYSSAKERLLCLLGEDTDLSTIRPAYSFELLERIALKLLEKIKDNKFDLYLYNVSISGFCWANKVKYAHCQFGVMLKDGIQPNEVTFTILIDAHVRNGRTNHAVALFNQMSSYGCSPDGITYNSLLNGLCWAGRGVDALCLLYAMHKRGFPPQKLAYQRVIHCLCAGGFGIPAFKVLEEMDRYGYCPRLFTLAKLSSALLQGNNLREYSVLVDIMGRHEKIINALAKRSQSRSSMDQIETDFSG